MRRILLLCLILSVLLPAPSNASLDQDLAAPRSVAVSVRDVTVVDGTASANLWVNFTESASDPTPGVEASDIVYNVSIIFTLPDTPQLRFDVTDRPIETRPGWITSQLLGFSKTRGNWSGTAEIRVRSYNTTDGSASFDSCTAVIAFVDSSDDDAFCGASIRPPDYFAVYNNDPDLVNFGLQVDLSWVWTVSEDDTDQDTGTGLEYYLVARESKTSTGAANPGGLRYYGPLPSTGIDGGGRRIFNHTGVGVGYLSETSWAMIARDPVLGVFSAPTCDFVISNDVVRPPLDVDWTDLIFFTLPTLVTLERGSAMQYCTDAAFAPDTWTGGDIGTLNPTGPEFPIIDLTEMAVAVGVDNETLGYILAGFVIIGSVVVGVGIGGKVAGGLVAGATVPFVAYLGLVPIWLIMVMMAVALFIFLDPMQMRRGT